MAPLNVQQKKSGIKKGKNIAFWHFSDIKFLEVSICARVMPLNEKWLKPRL